MVVRVGRSSIYSPRILRDEWLSIEWSKLVSSLAKGSLGASYMQVPESGTLVHGTPEASVRGKLGLSSLGRVYMGLKLVGLQAPRMMGVISTESCSTECFDLEGNLN